MNVITDLGGSEIAVRMTNSRFARQPVPALFTGWAKLRIAALLRFGDSGANITGTPRFGLGLCAGSTNILGDATTDHFAGVVTNGATWNRQAGTVYYYSVSPAAAKKVGTTLTLASNFASDMSSHTTGQTLFFVDITKGSPNYTFDLFRNNGASPVATLADFLSLSVATIPALSSHVLTTGVTLAVDEATNGTLDHACAWWNQTTPTMDILAWRVYRLA